MPPPIISAAGTSTPNTSVIGKRDTTDSIPLNCSKIYTITFLYTKYNAPNGTIAPNNPITTPIFIKTCTKKISATPNVKYL